MFNPSRLTIARQRLGLTKKELADRIGVKPRAISGYESGEYPPNEENLKKLSSALGFSQSFLKSDDLEVLSAGGVSFRSMSKMTSKQRDGAVAAGSIAYVLSDWVDNHFKLPDVDIPDFAGATPEIAALTLRQHWNLGELPISNMVHLLEAKGVRIFSLAENCAEVDAYSVWRGKRPFVFLNTMKSGERRRFDAAHELAHLVLHRHAAPNGVAAEKEANAFAGAFLMPTSSMRAIGRVIPSQQTIIEIKKKWQVSAVAMIFRLHEVRLLTYYHYQRLFSEASRQGWRSQEPSPIKPETSQVWKKVFSQLRSEGTSVEQLSEILSLPQKEIVDLIFGLVTVGLPTNDIVSNVAQKNSHLRLVE